MAETAIEWCEVSNRLDAFQRTAPDGHAYIAEMESDPSELDRFSCRLVDYDLTGDEELRQLAREWSQGSLWDAISKALDACSLMMAREAREVPEVMR
jgi:hypothetical protein